jgi:hypothetical protein
MFLVLLFAIAHHVDGAAPRGSTTTTTTTLEQEVQELNEATVAVHEPRALKGGKKGGKKGGGGVTLPAQPIVPPRPVVECEGCCCSLRDGITKCCGKTCANGMLCL